MAIYFVTAGAGLFRANGRKWTTCPFEKAPQQPQTVKLGDQRLAEIDLEECQYHTPGWKCAAVETGK